jgi:hypothetical protein
VTAIEAEGTPGNCGFGHAYSAKTWETTAWLDYFQRLVEIYVPAASEEPGAGALVERLQTDWRIFRLEMPAVREFLASAVPGIELDLIVRVDYHDGVDDHALSWAGFVDEVTRRNRFFPQSDFDQSALLAAALSNETTLRAGTQLFRARRCESEAALPINEMGPPPASRATAGRANPVGIAYLYAALDDQTAVHEARIANQEWCSVATFEVVRDLQVLNLADVEPPDAFADDDLRTRLSSSKLIHELARELSVPMRESDREISYVPTQYFCELIKSAGFDAVMYGSALLQGGKNIVLFDEGDVRGQEPVRLARVTAVSAEWAYE